MKTTLCYCCLLFSLSLNVFAGPTEETAAYFESIKTNPEALATFLKTMPKGGDLHMHASGSSFAEDLIHYAQNDKLCLNRGTLTVYVNPSCVPQDELTTVVSEEPLYNALIDAWSMRHFHGSGSESGHDHFFNAFSKFRPIPKTHAGEILAEITTRAAAQNELYLELMVTPDGHEAAVLGKSIGWDFDFEQLRQKLLGSNFDKILDLITYTLNQDESKREALQACSIDANHKGCGVTVRYLYQVKREQPKEMVFAQLLAGFEAASYDNRVVGVNLVQPEDGPIALRDYRLHMQMLAFFHERYPNVRISLHAGELNKALVPEEALSFHIREAVLTGSAERIGHGVSIPYEKHVSELLNKMAEESVMVEINLSSNDYILGIKGKRHPLALYLQYGVPVALSTDDEGVSREPLTRQFIRAAVDHGLSYTTLKQLARNSLYFAFISGDNLWGDAQYKNRSKACLYDNPESQTLSPICSVFLKQSEKANLQWTLERQFIAFERAHSHKNRYGE